LYARRIEENKKQVKNSRKRRIMARGSAPVGGASAVEEGEQA
jgi:hypothetical protein